MLISRVVLDHVPSAHGICLPAEHQLPPGQSSHCSSLLRPRLRPTVPAAHGVGAELPALQNEKSVQLLQLVALSSPWNVPAGHAIGSDALATQKPPRLQGRGCDDPPAHQLPSRQPMHRSSVTLRKVPEAHVAGMGTIEPSGQRKPSPQAMHAVCPRVPWYEPSAQLEQAPLELFAATVPGVQATAAVAPMLHACPGGQGRHASAA